MGDVAADRPADEVRHLLSVGAGGGWVQHDQVLVGGSLRAVGERDERVGIRLGGGGFAEIGTRNDLRSLAGQHA